MKTITGNWIIVDGQVVGDESCKLIRQLLDEKLKRVSASSDGWTILYQDKEDQSFWELTFPHGGWHGGGPEQLRQLSPLEVKRDWHSR